MNPINTKIKKSVPVIVIIALVAVVVIKLKSNKNTTQSKLYQYNKEQPLHVVFDTIKLKNVTPESLYTGTFEPNKETKISTEVQGKINTILVDAGSLVNKGQALIQLDNELLKLQLKNIEVQLEGLQADVKRFSVLAKADAIQGVQLEKAELSLKASKIQYATVLEQINKTTIKAPFGGVITAKLTEEGAFAAPGMPLLQLTDITQLKFTINVPEHLLRRFNLNSTYPVLADVYPNLNLNGKVNLIGSKANMGNSFPVQLTLRNTIDLKIKSGMFGKVNISNSEAQKAIIIPSSAIINNQNTSQVFVVKNGKAQLQQVVVAQKINNQSVIKSGLTLGDIIVTKGFINLFDGAPVKAN
jgi:RND family efflux transporter MFP subunit